MCVYLLLQYFMLITVFHVKHFLCLCCTAALFSCCLFSLAFALTHPRNCLPILFSQSPAAFFGSPSHGLSFAVCFNRSSGLFGIFICRPSTPSIFSRLAPHPAAHFRSFCIMSGNSAHFCRFCFPSACPFSLVLHCTRQLRPVFPFCNPSGNSIYFHFLYFDWFSHPLSPIWRFIPRLCPFRPFTAIRAPAFLGGSLSPVHSRCFYLRFVDFFGVFRAFYA